MQASQLIIPHDGFYDSTKSLLVVNLGSLQIHSLEKPKGDDKTNVSVKQLISMGKTEEDVLLHLREHSYDKFVLKIVDFQVCIFNFLCIKCVVIDMITFNYNVK